MRRALTITTAVIGLTLTVTGILLASGDPAVPFAAGMFTIGIMLLFLTAVVYNLVRDKEA